LAVSPNLGDHAAVAVLAYRCLLDGRVDPELFAEDLVYEQHFGVNEGSYAGVAGLRFWIDRMYDVWENVRGEFEVVRQADDALIGHFDLRVRAHETQIEMAMHGSLIARFDSAGRVQRLDAFHDRAAADAVWAELVGE
jgi:hypothetical protein